jgi:hypothetical protein
MKMTGPGLDEWILLGVSITVTLGYGSSHI